MKRCSIISINELDNEFFIHWINTRFTMFLMKLSKELKLDANEVSIVARRILAEAEIEQPEQ